MAATDEEPYPRRKVLYFTEKFELHVDEYENEEQDLFILIFAGQPRVYIPKKSADKIARFILFSDQRD